MIQKIIVLPEERKEQFITFPQWFWTFIQFINFPSYILENRNPSAVCTPTDGVNQWMVSFVVSLQGIWALFWGAVGRLLISSCLITKKVIENGNIRRSLISIKMKIYFPQKIEYGEMMTDVITRWTAVHWEWNLKKNESCNMWKVLC